jgi:hypothetical protein
VSLALNAILIAFAVSDATAPQPPSPASLTPAVQPRDTERPTASPKADKKAKTSETNGAVPSPRAKPVVGARSGALERKLLNLIVQAPAGKLPRALIDSRTGLAKNGLQAVCRRESGRAFLCVVQPPKHKPGEGLYVRYRVNRKGNGGTFRWYRYRSG